MARWALGNRALKGAEGARANTWQACFGARSLQGITEATTDLVVSAGANGLESALDHHRYGVAHLRGIFHKSKQLGDHLVFGALAVVPSGDDHHATRQAKRQRNKAVLADASWVDDGADEADIRKRPQGSGTGGEVATPRQWRTFLSILLRPSRTE